MSIAPRNQKSEKLKDQKQSKLSLKLLDYSQKPFKRCRRSHFGSSLIDLTQSSFTKIWSLIKIKPRFCFNKIINCV